jgi:glycosyltransferase involved in cell wall biosynthesis
VTPAVSIIIPCHNAEAWLGETIESALAQTWPGCEIVTVDDGSTDASLQVARRFELRGVTVISQAKKGASAARNTGFRASHGSFIQWLDSDDILSPAKIENQVRRLSSSPANRVASGPWGRFERSTAEAKIVPERNWSESEPVEWLTHNFAGRGMMPPVAWLTPRAVAQAAGPWDERLTLNDDGEYFCRVLLACSGIDFCPDAPSYYRSNLPGSLSGRRSAEAWDSAFLSHELCARHLIASEDSPRTRRACADLFQRLAYQVYPDFPDLAAACEKRAGEFGGSEIRPLGGLLFRLLACLLGWRKARALQKRGP